MMMPLLALRGLRRARGSAGEIDGHLNDRETPFPRHFAVEWDA